MRESHCWHQVSGGAKFRTHVETHSVQERPHIIVTLVIGAITSVVHACMFGGQVSFQEALALATLCLS